MRNPSISSGSRILVTGATGFIGRQAVSILAEKGYDVHAVGRENHDGITLPEAHWQYCDLLNRSERKRLIEDVRPTHVLHFAWIVTPGVYWTSPLNQDWQNATIDLLNLCKAHGTTRFVGAGTCAEYDWSDGHCEEGKTPLTPLTPYGKAKAECGRTVMDAHGDISTAWGRIFFLYGPHEHPHRLISSVTLSLLKGEVAKCTHGKQIRDFLHVHDVASAFVALLESNVQGAINIASGTPTTIREVVECIARQLHAEKRVAFGAMRPPANDPPRLTAAVERLREEVSWKPCYSLETGIADATKWWRRQED